jgi:hypothetical protein
MNNITRRDTNEQKHMNQKRMSIGKTNNTQTRKYTNEQEQKN